MQERLMDWPRITRRLFLFLTGTLFAKFGLGRAGTEPDNQALSASEILQRMAETYAKCKSYQDSGCVTINFIQDDGQHTDSTPFSTSFVRTGRFRFEFKSSFDGQTWHRYLVWADGTEIRTWWDIRPGVNQEPSLALALARATGVSGGSAITVTSLLLPDSLGGSCLTGLTQLRRLEDAAFEGVDCFRVQGVMLIEIDPAERERLRQKVLKLTGRIMETSEHGPKTLWIEKSTFLLHRIDETTQFEIFRTESRTTYVPSLNVAIADSQLSFDPPPNGTSGG
jgi:outer membrane lipoprotein-sorting protein